MSAVWATVAVLCVATASMKAIGPVSVGGRRLSGRAASVIALVAPSLLASLVVYETLNTDGPGIALDARLVGLAAGGAAIALKRSMLVVVAVAAIATALTRAVA
jgi:Branched-chain amino acid transport protein (AzlD)